MRSKKYIPENEAINVERLDVPKEERFPCSYTRNTEKISKLQQPRHFKFMHALCGETVRVANGVRQMRKVAI